MKFAEHLWSHLTPEWYSQYIAYEDLKRILTEWVTKAQQLPNLDENSEHEQLFLQADEQFFTVIVKSFAFIVLSCLF